jgi:hypothetical protein
VDVVYAPAFKLARWCRWSTSMKFLSPFFFSGIVYISESFFFSNCTVLTFETILLYLILL